MSPEDLRELEKVGTEARLGAGHVLIERGQHGTGLFVILEGTVVVEAAEGIVELGPGACVGERALLSADGKRTARVTVAEDVRVLAVDRAAFESLCASDPGFELRLVEAIR